MVILERITEPVVEHNCQDRWELVRQPQGQIVAQTINSWRLATVNSLVCLVNFGVSDHIARRFSQRVSTKSFKLPWNTWSQLPGSLLTRFRNAIETTFISLVDQVI